LTNDLFIPQTVYASSNDRRNKVEFSELLPLFKTHFKRSPQVTAEAPGRVNLLGEHTDYNDGFVFPAAIDRSMKMIAAARDDDTVRVFSADFGRNSEFSLSSIEKSSNETWSNYLRGVADQLIRNGFSIGGGDFLISGDVPVGAGLSSSAAYEVAAAAAFREMFGLKMDNVRLALLAQAAERQFVGVQCGIMDQFVSANARDSTALFLDCRDLTYENIPLDRETSIVVCDSDVQRALNNSAYNKRRIECEEAARLLTAGFPGTSALRDIPLDSVEENRGLLGETLYRRAHHVVSENERVLKGVDLLQAGNMPAFGRILFESHTSLKNSFEVSCPELDLLVDLAAECEGTLGSRMTGAGFGGCTVSLVAAEKTENFKNSIKPEYDKRTGRNCKIYACVPTGGVKAQKL
jgi:galactokinase